MAYDRAYTLYDQLAASGQGDVGDSKQGERGIAGTQRAGDRRNCNLNLVASPPSRPDLPSEPQLRGRHPRSLHLDRTGWVE